jgi:hypothetical protein
MAVREAVWQGGIRGTPDLQRPVSRRTGGQRRRSVRCIPPVTGPQQGVTIDLANVTRV